MRTIKFKGWHEERQKMYGPWGLGDLSYSSDGGTINLRDWEETCSVEDIEFIEFTGLFDKNGKEIYEGDICKRTDGYVADDYEVRMGEGRWEIHSNHYAFEGVEYGNTDELYPIAHKVEVIGNIYENPELLEGK